MRIIVILIIVSVALFFPVYDLEFASVPGYEEYQIERTNILTLGACRKAASSYKHYGYGCMKKTLWGQLTNDYSKYDSRHQ